MAKDEVRFAGSCSYRRERKRAGPGAGGGDGGAGNFCLLRCSTMMEGYSSACVPGRKWLERPPSHWRLPGIFNFSSKRSSIFVRAKAPR
jgi:hypothetical protein